MTNNKPQPATSVSRAALFTVGMFAVMSSWAIPSHATVVNTEQPKLLVTILVDGLDERCLELLRPSMSPNGFNRLYNDGLSVASLDYGYQPNSVSAAAVLLTGSGAHVNGIPSKQIYDVKLSKANSVLTDLNALGNFTKSTLSPKNIAVSTLADEIKIDGAGLSKVYSVAVAPETAIILSGHAGNSAVWLDESVPTWASTTYYREVPLALSKKNYSAPLSAKLDTMLWTPTVESSQIASLPISKRKTPFNYSFSQKKGYALDAFRFSPKANEEVTDFAVNLLKELSPTSSGIDMLGIGYNLSPFPYARTADSRYELYDAYLRLDKDLSQIIKAAEKAAPGRNIIMLAGVPPTSNFGEDDEQWRLPGGKFSPKKALSLLNMYLMAIHGNGDWVTGYFNKQFYLNSKLAEDRQVSITQLRDEASKFLSKMSGVRRASSIDSLLVADQFESILESKSGDVFIDILPGWSIENQTTTNAYRHNSVERALPIMPLYVLVPNSKGQRFEGRYDARMVAPTIAGILRIRSPGAASQPALF